MQLLVLCFFLYGSTIATVEYTSNGQLSTSNQIAVAKTQKDVIPQVESDIDLLFRIGKIVAISISGETDTSNASFFREILYGLSNIEVKPSKLNVLLSRDGSKILSNKDNTFEINGLLYANTDNLRILVTEEENEYFSHQDSNSSIPVQSSTKGIFYSESGEAREIQGSLFDLSTIMNDTRITRFSIQKTIFPSTEDNTRIPSGKYTNNMKILITTQ